MDTLIEQIYKHKNTLAENLKKFGILAAVLVSATVVMTVIRMISTNYMLYMFGGLLCIGIVYIGAKFYMHVKNIEYEYTYYNGEMDIDKIMSQAFRKRIITVNYKHFKEYGDYDESVKEKLKSKQIDTVVDVTSNTGAPAKYALLQHPSQGITLLIFEPNERIREDLERRLGTVLR